MRVLCIGSSHAAVLYHSRSVLEGNPDIQMDWFVTPANVELLFGKGRGELSYPENYPTKAGFEARKCLVADGGKRAYAMDYDAILYSSIGVRPHGVFAEHPVHAFAKMPVSNSYLRAMIEYTKVMQMHFGNLRRLRELGFSGRIICENWIRPHMLLPGVDPGHWQIFCAEEQRVLDDFAKEVGAEMLGYLEGCDVMTENPDLVSVTHTHATHGSQLYARQILAKFFKHLKDTPKGVSTFAPARRRNEATP